jgi:hypothetical protein
MVVVTKPLLRYVTTIPGVTAALSSSEYDRVAQRSFRGMPSAYVPLRFPLSGKLNWHKSRHNRVSLYSPIKKAVLCIISLIISSISYLTNESKSFE